MAYNSGEKEPLEVPQIKKVYKYFLFVSVLVKLKL